MGADAVAGRSHLFENFGVVGRVFADREKHRLGTFIRERFEVCSEVACGTRYPVTKIATEKGGCNPVPINANIQSKDGQLVIKEAELAALAKYF